MKRMTKAQLMAALQALGTISDEQRNSVICSLIGHSRIQEFCFGYFYCGRCGQKVGDSLGGVYPEAADVVIVGHNCETCQANYRKLTWRDKLFAPEPFPEEGEAS